MKKIYLFIVGILICLIISGCDLFSKNETKKEENVINNNADETIINDEDVYSDTPLPKESHMGRLFSKLDLKGEELYNSKAYLNFTKNDDIYFISLKELSEKYNYDISEFKGEDGTICDIDKSGILFDIDNKIRNKENPDSKVVSIIIGC